MISTRLASGLAFGDDSLHERLGNAFKMLDLDARVLFIQEGLRSLIDHGVCRPQMTGPFFLRGAVKLRYGLVARALALFLRVAVVHDESHYNH